MQVPLIKMLSRLGSHSNQKVYLFHGANRRSKIDEADMKRMTVKAVVFDLDGTLTGFNIDQKTVRAEVRSYLVSIGVPASVLSSNESVFEMLKKTEIYMKNNAKTMKAMNEARERALAIAEKFEMEAAKTTDLFPGAEETLKLLREMALKLGLCTINSEKSTNYVLKRFKIADYFDAVISRNKVKYVKPNTEHLEAVLKALGVGPEETVVVGDSTVDMRCASEMKAIAVGIPTGVSSPKELISSGANYFVTSISDLPRLIECMNKGPQNE